MTETPTSLEHELSPEQLAEHVSLLMIKPENSGKIVLFPHILNNHGLKTEEHKAILTEEIIQKLYPDIGSWPPQLQQATYDHLLNKEVVVFLVTHDTTSPIAKENVVQQVLSLRGLSTNPENNAPATLRSTFYGKQHALPESDITYWENGLHCPRDPQELVSNLVALNLSKEARKLVQVSSRD